MTTTYERCADTAKRVRAALKANFPGTTFSVRSKTYSGGASIRIHWTDGPRRKDVERIASRYEGADFDGMTDCKSYKSAIVVDETGPREIHYGSDFVFCNREVSTFDADKATADAMIRARCHVEGDRFGNHWVEDLARGMAWDRAEGEPMDAAFRRVVLRETA